MTRTRARIGLTAWIVALCGGCESSPVPSDARAVGFDVRSVPSRDTCVPGTTCLFDCLPENAPCWNCGSWYYDSNCVCVLPNDSGSCAIAWGCEQGGVARLGEFCGTRRWCNRPCAPGLSCTGFYMDRPNERDYRRVCVVDGWSTIVDASADAASDTDVVGRDASDDAGD